MSAESHARVRDEIAARPCECVSCGDCRGTGTMWIPDRMGLGMDEPEQCDTCDGTGVTEVCDRCADLYEAFHDDDRP